MSLAALQRDFRNWLTDRPETMDYWIDTHARPGLDVYHNAYRVQLVECLKETFEKTLLWIGEDSFIGCARIHIERNPPSSWTLGAYGQGFAITLRELYPEDPEIPELAWLDWALGRAFESADTIPVTIDMLQNVDWDNARLTVAPGIQTGPARTNAGAIWSALSAQGSPPAAAMLPASGSMLVWRQQFTPCFRTVETIEEHALALIREGASFGKLCAVLIERLGEEAGIARAGLFLSEWIGSGLIIAVE